ncbi:MAG: hypothetical protein C0608_01540 [Deltaproteobacteria bacterium]|nr:MAG: hypothetical protein C0608_01540 [Deltaproteobacteria bacterium]
MKTFIKNFIALSLLAALALFLGGCKEVGAGLTFSHDLHRGEAECSTCHAGKDGSMRTTMEPCKECHEIDEANPSEDCLMCHLIGKDKGYAVNTTKPASYADVTFEHDVHEDVDCKSCHGEVSASKSLSAEFLPTMETCQKCHNGDDAPADCSTCHTKIEQGEKPMSHTALWAKSHSMADEASCAYCHEGQDPCMECHRTTKPSSHTAGWKLRGHGLEATLDSDGCSECHVATYCSDCHANAPRNHRPLNGWLANGHGIEGSIDSDGCFVCHTSNESSCRGCHTAGF